MSSHVKLPQRRRFLRQVASVAAATASASLLSASNRLYAATNRWKMRLSTSTIQLGSLSVEEAFARISELGFEAVDIWPNTWIFKTQHLETIDQRYGAAGLKDLLAKYKLKLCAFSCYAPGYAKYAKLLGDAGGGIAILSAGKVTGNLSKDMKAFLEELKPQLELAEKNNSYLAIENHPGLLYTLDSIKAFVEMNTNPRLGIALTPYHLQTARIPVEDAIKLVGRQLFFFYAWQNAEGLKQLPGIGPTDCTPWFAALAKANYGGYVNPFMHFHPAPDEMASALAKSRDYLRRCSDMACRT